MANPAAGNPLTVAIVEDDSPMRAAFASAVMRDAGLQLLGAASNLADGLALVQRCRPDVLLIDLGLPDGNGIELIRAALALREDTEAIVVSTLGDELRVLAAIEAGATGYLLKDASAAELVAQITVLRNGGSPVSPVIARRLMARLGDLPTASGAAARHGGSIVPTGGEDTRLSPKEQEVLRYSALGYTVEEIAERMGVSRHTIGTYVKRSYRKLQVHSRTQALMEARRRGLLDR